MKKDRVLKDVFGVISLYKDYLEHGFREPHDIPEFTVKEHEKPAEEAVPAESAAEMSPEIRFTLKEKRRMMIDAAQAIIRCKKCGLHNDCRKVPGIGDVSAKLFIVSYPPAATEEAAQRPVTGEAFDFLQKWLGSVGIEMSDIFLTNLVKCPLKKSAIEKDEIEACRSHLDRQIDIVKPSLILSLGQLTASSLRKKYTSLDENHGEIFQYNFTPFMPTYHPAEVLKDAVLKKAVWNDMKKMRSFLDGTPANG